MKIKIYENQKISYKHTAKAYKRYYLRQLGSKMFDWCETIDRKRGLI